MQNKKLEYYNVVIATNQYAGNFEREMGGFVTGKQGDGLVSDEEISHFVKYSKTMDPEVLKELNKNALECDGEDSEYEGCECVAEMVEVPNESGKMDNTGVAIHFKKKPSAALLQYVKDRVEQYTVHRATIPTRMGDLNPGLKILNVTVEKVVREWRYVIEKTPVPV